MTIVINPWAKVTHWAESEEQLRFGSRREVDSKSRSAFPNLMY